MNCKDCEECCSCHINPPCNFCTEHYMCDNCGEVFCQTVEISDETAWCNDCLEMLAEESEGDND